MLWISLAIIVVFGGATLFFHNPTFIKWKPTALYWLFGGVLLGSAWLLGRNLIRAMLEAQIKLPDPVWARLNLAWAGFFIAMGVLNLWVAYNFSEEAWVNFKMFGGMGLMEETGIERFWRDLRVHSILEGTNQVMRMIVGRDMLRQ